MQSLLRRRPQRVVFLDEAQTERLSEDASTLGRGWGLSYPTSSQLSHPDLYWGSHRALPHILALVVPLAARAISDGTSLHQRDRGIKELADMVGSRESRDHF